MHARSALRPTPLALVALLLAAAALVFAAFSPLSRDADAAATAKVVNVTIKDYKFSPKTITIKKGQSVRWTNKDEMKHDATTSQSGGPKGPLLAKGKSYTWKATKTGTFNYHCSPHPFMKGTIVVK